MSIRILLLCCLLVTQNLWASSLLIPMDDKQTNHLKAYGITYWVLEGGLTGKWLLNYRGGSFLVPNTTEIQTECFVRGVKFEVISDAQEQAILSEIAQETVNMDDIKLEKAPKIAVYSPKGKQPWDDAVTLVLTYAQIPYEVVYDAEILEGKLKEFDWLHLHHEDFTGQYGKFYRAFHHTDWYQKQVASNEKTAHQFGFKKVSQLKLSVAKIIQDYVKKGGFLFAMCSATDSYDIALAAENTDICATIYDGDAMSKNAQKQLNFDNTFAFTNFLLKKDPLEYEYSNIDQTQERKVRKDSDFFTLFEFSAKWDPVPTMMTQNHTNIIKGFMGQTTSYKRSLIKNSVLIMGENKAAGEARYIHGNFGKGMWTFYGGHDPEDYRHMVYDPPTDLDNHPNSPGYRLILNNVLFPAAKKKKIKT